MLSNYVRGRATGNAAHVCADGLQDCVSIVARTCQRKRHLSRGWVWCLLQQQQLQQHQAGRRGRERTTSTMAASPTNTPASCITMATGMLRPPTGTAARDAARPGPAYRVPSRPAREHRREHAYGGRCG